MKKFWSAILAAMLALSCCLPAFAAGQSAYPTQWDLTEIYPTAEAWQTDYAQAGELVKGHEDFRGKLSDAQTIHDYLQFAYMGELTRLENKLYLYASLGNSLNPADAVYADMMAKLSVLFSNESRLSAFASPEIFAIPMEKRQEIFADPLLKPYAYACREYLNPDREPLGEEALAALAVLSPAMGRANAVYDILNSVDLPNPVITDPEGNEITLTDETYAQIVYGDRYDREFKGKCNEVILTKYKPYVNTFAALLDASASENWANAQINKYASSREAALAASDVDPAVYDMIIEAAHKGAPDYRRYLSAHRRGVGLEVQYPFDMGTFVSDYAAVEITYDEAVEQVREALAVLGDEYIAIFDRMIERGHLDVYPTDTKVTGAFSMGAGNEHMPFMLFNFAGLPSDVSTLAHEMGHSVYTYLSAENQEDIYASPGIFTHEVTSTTNELLYYTYKINSAVTDDEKLFYLEDVLSMFSGTMFMQVLYAEFEDELYKTVEAGGALDAEVLSDRWAELYTQYRGDEIKTFPDGRYQWASIPHFYYNYYVYQYATSVCYAASLCERIISGEPGAVEAYLNFLTLGCSASPAELLRAAGVDPLAEDSYQRALEYFGGLVDEYERLVDAKLAAE